MLRLRLANVGVDVRVVHGDATPQEAARRDAGDLSWAEFRPNRFFRVGNRTIIWQPVVRTAREADLVVVEQASRLVTNYVLLASQALGSTPVAFWGDGENHVPHAANATAEFVKRHISRFPHWWFAYTDGSRQIVERLGYPAERITVVQNATATPDFSDQAVDVAAFRKQHALGDGPIGLFMGSLYREKRLPFLLAAADRIHARCPEFRLVLVGDGPERADVIRRVVNRPYARLVGPRFGSDRATPLAAARVMLMPGLVGLAIVDGFAAGLPLVTTAVDYHGPEIGYVRDGTNAVIVRDTANVDEYADAVWRVISDSGFHHRLVEGCRAAAAVYTLDAMVERFADGIERALAAPRFRPYRIGALVPSERSA
jgi:glycosyltransferase involved in cell wall biosynthesis